MLACGCGIGSLLASAPALAQVTPPQGALPSTAELAPRLPDSSEPMRGTIRRRGEQGDCPAALKDSTVTVSIERIEFKRPDPAQSDALIDLQPEIADALSSVSAPGGNQPVSVVCAIRDRANDALRSAGWVATVQIPPQEIAGGKLQLLVVSAHITEMRVHGSPGPYAALLRRRIEALKAMDPLNERAAERILLQAGDMPGLEVSLALRPAGGRSGEVIGELDVRYRRFAVMANVQNYNSKLIGRETAYVRAEAYGLTGLADLTYIGFSTTADLKEQKVLQLGHSFQITGTGTRLGGRFTYAWSRPDLGTLDYRTDTLIAGLDVEHPLLRTVTSNAVLTGGIEYVNQGTKIYSGKTGLPLTSDRMRILFAGIAGDTRSLRVDGSARWALEGHVELRKGLKIFDASDSGFAGPRYQSRIDGKADAFVARADARAFVGLGRYFSIEERAQAQWSDDALLNYEEFSLGNLTIGRGYDPGSNSGDRAFGLASEVQVKLPLSGKVTAQVFGFYDIVTLDNLDASSTEVDRLMRSYGGGIRLGLPGSALLEVTYAHPLDRALRIDPAPPPDRLLVSLSFRFRDNLR